MTYSSFHQHRVLAGSYFPRKSIASCTLHSIRQGFLQKTHGENSSTIIFPLTAYRLLLTACCSLQSAIGFAFCIPRSRSNSVQAWPVVSAVIMAPDWARNHQLFPTLNLVIASGSYRRPSGQNDAGFADQKVP
jgi:hypothetical protein